MMSPTTCKTFLTIGCRRSCDTLIWPWLLERNLCSARRKPVGQTSKVTTSLSTLAWLWWYTCHGLKQKASKPSASTHHVQESVWQLSVHCSWPVEGHVVLEPAGTQGTAQLPLQRCRTAYPCGHVLGWMTETPGGLSVVQRICEREWNIVVLQTWFLQKCFVVHSCNCWLALYCLISPPFIQGYSSRIGLMQLWCLVKVVTLSFGPSFAHTS